MKRKYYVMTLLMVISFGFISLNSNAADLELLNLTGKITNPSFENDLSGWTIQNGVFTDGTTLSPGIATNRKRTGSKSVNFNTQYGAQFQTECRIYQTISGLTPGEYKLVAYKCFGRWEAANGIFANGGLGEVKSTGTSSATYDFIEHSVTFIVNEAGVATIGGYASSRRGASDRPDYFWLDDFELYKVGSLTRQMEYLDRGLVAVSTSSGVFLSWRLLGTDSPNTTFNVYRNGVLVNGTPISGATNITDTNGNVTSSYVVKTLVNNVVTETSKTITPWSQKYMTIQLNCPNGGTSPDGVAYTYSPNDCSVGDLDGDGEYEIIVKWDPSNSKDNANSGYTGNVYLDAYKIDGTQLWRIDLGKNIRAGAHYTQFMVYDLDGDGISEIACKTAPGTIDGKGKYVTMGSDSPTADYRNSSGYILSGPEYFTVFNGTTGGEITTVAYEPGRGTVANWGDSYGNRVDRFLAAIAYLDGERPSVVMCRGYYTRSVLVAYDYRNGTLKKRWTYDSGTSNIEAYGQGNHNLSVGDVDGDGKDEIIYGSCAINDDGSFMYRTGLGHGDAMHLTKIDPDLPGLQVFAVHESSSATYGYEVHDAATGKIIWGTFTGNDNGRGLAADIDPTRRGLEVWSSGAAGIFDCKGNKISDTKPASSTGSESTDFRIYWDGDLQDELLDRNVLTKWNWTKQSTDRIETLYNYGGAGSNNSSKYTPSITADLFGDWREEIIMRSGSDQLVVFTTTIPTEHKLYSLMHDPIYRLGVAWQNVSYNQPPHLGFYIGDGLDDIPTPNIYTPRTTVRTLSSQKIANTPSDYEEKVYTTQSSIKAYSDNNGIIQVISSEAPIQSIMVYSINGKLLYQDSNINNNEYQYSNQTSDNILIIKVITRNGVNTIKVLNK